MDTKHIFVIMGPAGCGKTSVAKALAKEMGMPVLEGDECHSSANKQKMANGEPLDDNDRWPWLISCCEAATAALKHDTARAVFLSCSALKKRYRDVIRIAVLEDSMKLHFVYLKVEEKVLIERIEKREGHYMKAGMVESQLKALEEPDAREKDAVTVNAVGNLERVVEQILDIVRGTLGDS